MRKEVKDILGLLIIVLPAFTLVFACWLHSPMYEEVKSQQEAGARLYLAKTYYQDLTILDPFVKGAMMEHYGLTDEDINPQKIMERFIEAQNEESD